MKKIITFPLVIALLFSLCACDGTMDFGATVSNDSGGHGGNLVGPGDPNASGDIGDIIIYPDDIFGSTDDDSDDSDDNTGNPEVPGDDPVDPGDDPVDPGDDPVNPGDDPVDPGDDPVDPGDDPVNPGDDPVDPGDDPGMECNHVPYIHTTMDLSVYGGCAGSVLYVFSCQCRQYGYVDAEFACMPGNDNVDTNYIDENGVEHTVFHIQCRDCELDFYSEITETTMGCVLDITEHVRVNLGFDWNLLDIRYSTQEVHHDFETTIIMNGESCADGFIEADMCKYCGEVDEMMYYNYHRVYPVEEIPLPDENYCGGYLEYSVCNCGQVESYYFIHNCAFWAYSLGEPEWRDEEGILHSIFYRDCEYCDLLVECDTYSLLEGCTAYIYTCSTARIGDIVVFENVTSLVGVDEYHDCEEFIEMRGDTCADGFVHTWVCRRCGQEDVHDSEVEGYEYDPHIMFQRERIFLADLGFCGGWFERYSCCCRYYDKCNVTFYCENTITEREWEYDENGFERRTNTTTCADCGLVMVEHFYTEVRDCVAYNYIRFSLYRGDTTIVHEATHMSTSEIHHTYQTTYELMGESCTDGVKKVSECIYCGDQIVETSTEHLLCDETTISMQEYGCCDGEIIIRQCLCKADALVWYKTGCKTELCPGEIYTDENGAEHHLQTSYCVDCGIYIYRDVYYVYVPTEDDTIEVYAYERSYVVTKDGEVLFDVTYPYG